MSEKLIHVLKLLVILIKIYIDLVLGKNFHHQNYSSFKVSSSKKALVINALSSGNFFGLILPYFSNKCPGDLINFKYQIFKRRRRLFQRKRKYSHEISKLEIFSFQITINATTKIYIVLSIQELLVSYFHFL